MSNSEEAKEKVTIETVGGLIWVKRKNGMWWPGQILEIKDVPRSSLASEEEPGTPVKLLGKDDARIEWFKLEKTKRIKAFRCPESVEWLKGCNTTAVNSDKYAIYAKRKDAIAQALRIEVEQKSTRSDMPISAGQEDESKRLPGDMEDMKEISPSDKKVDQLSHSGESSESADSVEETPQASGQVSPKGRSKGVQRMRLLEDLGIPSKRMRTPTHRALEYLASKSRCHAQKTPLVSVAVTKDNETPQYSSNKAIESSSMPVTVGHPCDLPVPREDLAGLSSKYVSGAPEIVPVGAAAESSPDSQFGKLCLGDDKLTESGPDSSEAATTVNMGRGIEEGKPEQNTKRKRNSRTAIRSKWCWASLAPRNSDAVPVTSSRLVAYDQYDSTIIQEYHPLDVHLGGLYDPARNLYDVDLVVNAMSRPPNVPFISLLSKLTHKPIVGHALDIEALDDGFCDNLVSGSSCYINSSDEDWDESAGRKGRLDSSGRRTGTHGPYKLRKKVTFCESPTYHEIESCAVRRKSRRISSLLAASQEQCIEDVQNQLVTKPKVSTLDCVPLKTVFSRINAALNP